MVSTSKILTHSYESFDLIMNEIRGMNPLSMCVETTCLEIIEFDLASDNVETDLDVKLDFEW